MQNVESKGGGSKRVLGIRKVLSIAIAASFDPVRRFVQCDISLKGVSMGVRWMLWYIHALGRCVLDYLRTVYPAGSVRRCSLLNEHITVLARHSRLAGAFWLIIRFNIVCFQRGEYAMVGGYLDLLQKTERMCLHDFSQPMSSKLVNVKRFRKISVD